MRRPLARTAAGLFGGLVLLAAAGCTTGTDAAPPARGSSAVLAPNDEFGCAPRSPTVTLPSGELGKVLGRGPNAVVFVNPSGDDPCAWLPYAQTVADRGYQVLLWYYGKADRLGAVPVAVKAMRDRGASLVLLVGGSQGAGLSVAAAGTITPPPAGVVAMSPGTSTQGVSSLPDAFAALRVPLLEVIAEEDCTPQGLGPCRSLFDRVAGSDKVFMPVPGTAHATALLHGDHADEVVTSIDRFIATNLPK